MAALAYLLLPFSGLIAFLVGGSTRLRFHGLQAIVFGTVWAVALYSASAVAAGATLVVGGAGALAWLVLGVAAALGKDLRLPLIAGMLERIAVLER